jgi:hypothetical protein
MRWLALVSLLGSLAASCVSHTSSDLVGTMSLTLDATPIHASSPSDKLRAQIDDDGISCKLDVSVTSAGHSILSITTYQDELGTLLQAGSADITASDHLDRSLVTNGASVYVTPNAAESWFSRSGILRVSALPAPKGSLAIQFDVTMTDGTNATRKLTGSLEATYVGVVSTKDKRACPQLAAYPGGMVF